ncbi:hypothetical protein FQN51_000531 [Onygenales sp. PD_10]|nr:hypothetical protein FQN51_000531 [Onygenales sp. PD_10]
MEDPVAEIPHVIHLLTQSIPSVQKQTIERFFTPSASFTHPFCRTGSFEGSRWFIIQVYRWYKIMSPNIDLDVHSVAHKAFDPHTLTLYVTASQTFRIFIIPFYKANARLTAVLTLTSSTSPADTPSSETEHPSLSSSWTSAAAPSPNPMTEPSPDPHPPVKTDKKTLYYISAQEDLYQTSEVIKFVLPFGIGVFLAVVLQFLATVLCVLGAWALWPISWAEDRELFPLGRVWRIRRGIGGEKKRE